MSDKNSRYRDLFTGVIGLSLGGILGNLFTYLIIISGVVSWLLNLIPESQPLVRFFTAIISAFLIIALGGAVTGIINGLSLNRIDREAVRGYYIFGSGYAFAIAQGILVIPVMLLISLISFYNNAPRTQPSAYLIFFGMMGLIFGFLIDLVLSLITVRLRFGWRVLLAAILGYTIGGCLFGLALYNANLISVGTSNTMRALSRLIVLTIAIYIPSGAALGLAYHLIAKKRITSEDEKLNSSRWQIIGVLAISLLIFVSVAGVVQQAKRFLTVRPSTTATQLSDKTVGVHWATPVILPVNAGGLSISDVGIAVNDDGFLVVGWRQESENGSDIYYIFQDTMENANSNGLENRVGIDVFEKELANRGLEDLVKVRFFNGRVHAKSALIDQEFLVIGSQNFHYSAWGEEGLLEYGVATDDPEAIAQYQKMFAYYWEQAIPAEESDWTNTG